MMNWHQTTIGAVCESTHQRNPQDFPDQRFTYVDISSINRATRRIIGTKRLLGSDAPSRARKEIRFGDVLVSTVRPNLNTVAIVPSELDGQIASTGYCVLRAKRADVDPRFLFYRCQSGSFIADMTSKAKGANYPAVTDSVVKASPLSLPPLPEQHRIVEILDQADALRRKRREADALSEKILPALFRGMFGDPVENPMGWRLTKLKDLLEGIDSGWSPKCETRAAGNEWAILKLGAVTWCDYRPEENKALASGFKPRPEIEVK